MKHLAAYVLCVIGGNAKPTADDLIRVLSSVRARYSRERIDRLLSLIKDRDIFAVMKIGKATHELAFTSLMRELAWKKAHEQQRTEEDNENQEEDENQEEVSENDSHNYQDGSADGSQNDVDTTSEQQQEDENGEEEDGGDDGTPEEEENEVGEEEVKEETEGDLVQVDAEEPADIPAGDEYNEEEEEEEEKEEEGEEEEALF